MAIGSIVTNQYKLDVTGTVRTTGAMTATGFGQASDRHFKTQVQPLTNALTSIQALRGVRYQWNTLGVQRGGTAGAEQVGRIAQELEAVKEQQAEIDALKAQDQALQGQTVVDHASLVTLQEQIAHLLSDRALTSAKACK